MEILLQLNPQVEISRPRDSLLSTLVEQVRVADHAGFSGFSMGEHYNIPDYQRLHQIPLLARLSAESNTAIIGTAVSLSGLRHPVALASELASLDVINGGRSFFGFGLGYRDEELQAFGLSRAERFSRFVESIEIIRRLWTEDHVSFEGASYQLADVTSDPKPMQHPRPPMLLAANSDVAVERAARLGDGWLIGPHSALDELEHQVTRCRAAWTAAGKPGEPSMPIIRETFVARSRREAFDKARPILEQLYGRIYIQWRQNAAMTNPEELAWDFARLARDRFILGSPEDCIAQIRDYEARLGTSRMLVRFDWTPGLGQEDVLASMRLFGREVLPHL